MNYRKESALQLDLRKLIYQNIEKFPGTHFRELQRKTKIGTGNLEYHLKFLEKSNLIKTQKSKGNKRFFPLGLNDFERKILSILRQNNFRKIILNLLNKNLTNKQISKILNLSPSSTNWYLKNLEQNEIISTKKSGREKFYKLENKENIIKILITYKESFLDKLVNKFIDAWEEF